MKMKIYEHVKIIVPVTYVYYNEIKVIGSKMIYDWIPYNNTDLR